MKGAGTDSEEELLRAANRFLWKYSLSVCIGNLRKTYYL